MKPTEAKEFKRSTGNVFHRGACDCLVILINGDTKTFVDSQEGAPFPHGTLPFPQVPVIPLSSVFSVRSPFSWDLFHREWGTLLLLVLNLSLLLSSASKKRSKFHGSLVRGNPKRRRSRSENSVPYLSIQAERSVMFFSWAAPRRGGSLSDRSRPRSAPAHDGF